MSINVYTTFADGYERHMRMFLNYYLDFVDRIFVVYDTRTKDRCDFLDSFACGKITYKAFDLRENNGFSEDVKGRARSFFYHQENCNADFNIIADCDEFIVSPHLDQSLVEFLCHSMDGDYFHCKGFNVGTEDENNGYFFQNLPSLRSMKYLPVGAYNKPIISRRHIVIPFSSGCHGILENNLTMSQGRPFLLHSKYLNTTYNSKNIEEVMLAAGKPGTSGFYEHMRDVNATEGVRITNLIKTEGLHPYSVFSG